MPPPANLIAIVLFLAAVAGCSPAEHSVRHDDVFLIFFEEFSANILPEAKSIVDEAAAEAKRQHIRSIRIEARANATGSPDATMKLAETRAAVIRDALQADGIRPDMIRLVPVGQAGTTDRGVGTRRVDIILEK